MLIFNSLQLIGLQSLLRHQNFVYLESGTGDSPSLEKSHQPTSSLSCLLRHGVSLHYPSMATPLRSVGNDNPKDEKKCNAIYSQGRAKWMSWIFCGNQMRT